MTKYRLLCATESSQHMRPERHFDARNDAEAITLAEACRSARAAELWTSRYRLVASWRAGASTPEEPKSGRTGSLGSDHNHRVRD